MGVDRALRHPARDPELRQPRRRPLRPAPRHPVRDAGHQGRRSTRATTRWIVETDKGDASSARFVITAMGCLSSPNTPKIPGLADFEGPTYHTGNWPHEGVDFTGKTVGVIGTGSSAIQSIPIIAQQAKHLTVFQRTANYTIPAHNRPLDPDYVREVKANYRDDAQAGEDAAGRHRPQDQHGLGDRDAGGGAPPPVPGALGLWRAGLHGRLQRPAAERRVEQDGGGLRAREDPRDRQGSRDARRCCTPTNIIGCKRLCVDTGYWATFNRPNVTLVDVSDEPIERITPTGAARQGPGLRLRLPGAGDRLRRHDRRAAARSTSAAATASR